LNTVGVEKFSVITHTNKAAARDNVNQNSITLCIIHNDVLSLHCCIAL